MDVPTLCLAVLSRGPASGYEIRKAFGDGPFAHIHEASFGSIYPSLRRLEEQGLAEGAAEQQDGRPDKRVYRITDSGRATLRRALMAPPRPDRVRSDALVVLCFAHLVPAETVATALDLYLAQHRAVLSLLTGDGCADCATPGERFVHGFGVAIYQAAVSYIENHRAAFVDATAATPAGGDHRS
ncbi:MAG: PadR family transcriptional regulator [Alphaproteobacteria bacterium]